jgi:hypothetical protein
LSSSYTRTFRGWAIRWDLRIKTVSTLLFRVAIPPSSPDPQLYQSCKYYNVFFECTSAYSIWYTLLEQLRAQQSGL